MKKKIISVIVTIAMCMTFLPVINVFATDINDSSVFIKQSGSGRCTIASITMILRRHALRDGNANWSSITEAAVAPYGWVENAGARLSFSFSGMNVTYGMFSGDKKAQLINLLNAHPEGVVVYSYGYGLKQHAVIATDYDSSSDTVYCADPARGMPSGRIALTRAWLSGSNQNEVIGNLKQFWYIPNGSCDLSGAAVEPDVHTHTWVSAHDSAHPHYIYDYCSSCGEKKYLGSYQLDPNCAQCYPLGSARFTRSFEKTGKTATFYRNNITNATGYTLKLYKDGSLYGTYNMTYSSFTVSGLDSGYYGASLVYRNSNTNEEKSASCNTFRILDTYPVTFNANGGSNAPASQTKIQDSDLTLPSSKPTRTGYVFKGWAASKTATEAKYAAGGIYNKNAKITLYAVWEPEVYNITFDANGGKGTLENTTITYGNTMKMPNTIIKDGCYLRGWSTSKSTTAPEYKLNMDYALTADTTLYAVWGNNTWSGDVAKAFAGGSGTESDPYKISDSAELAHLAGIVNAQTAAPDYKYYILTDNINLGYNEWVPIGLNGNQYQYFRGSFDGNGYTISDMKISDVNEDKVGLFGYTMDSKISKLTLAGDIDGLSSTSQLYAGSIDAYAENTDISACNATYVNISNIVAGTSANSDIGGICGYLKGNITNSKANETYIGLKNGNYNAGMLAGYISGNVDSCKVTSEEELFGGTTSTGNVNIGGICGDISGTIKNSTVSSGQFSNNMKAAAMNAGGITGTAESASEITLCTVKYTGTTAKTIDSSSYPSSFFANTTGVTKAGGLVGYSASGAKLKDCEYDGRSLAVTGTAETSVGGMIGSSDGNVIPSFTVTGGQPLSRASLPQRDGYKATWYTDSACTKEYDFSQTISADVTLYAKWTEDKTGKQIWDGTTSEPAYDSTTKTYTVSNGKELAWVSAVVGGKITTGTNLPSDKTFSGYTIVLSDDIYLNDTSNSDNWETTAPANIWTPIGGHDMTAAATNGYYKSSDTYVFAGTFDGKGNAVNGMYNNINDSTIGNNGNNVGLFGYISNGTIKNVVINKSYISGYSNVGGITGYLQGGNVSCCYNSCIIKGNVKYVDSGFKFPEYLGGIIGYVHGRCKISFCGNSGTIKGRGYYIGGIIGYISGNTSSEPSGSYEVKNCYNSGKINGEDDAGGIIGEENGSSTATISNCYNVGDITVGDWGAGGIAGVLGGVLNNCYNRGNVSAYNYTGGICGSVDMNGYASYCYNTNTNVTASKGWDSDEEGLLVGSLHGSLSYSYAPGSNLYKANSASITSVSNKSLSQMKSLSNLPGFSSSIWATSSSINDGYPYLRSLESSYKSYKVTTVTDVDDATKLERCVANVDGIVYGKSSANANVGGFMGSAGAAGVNKTPAENIVVSAARVSAVSDSASAYAYAGDIIGHQSYDAFDCSNNNYSYSALDLASANTAKSANAASMSVSTTKTLSQMTRASFLRTVLGPNPYSTVDNLKNNPQAVWVIKDDVFPELYYNKLKDVSLSNVTNGTITADKAQAVNGEIVTITATPSEGYVLNKIYVNGQEITGTTFELADDSNVYATFAEKTPEYKVTVASTSNASATVSDADSASLSDDSETTTLTGLDGSEIAVNATADKNYTVDSVYVNDEEMTGKSFILTNDSVVKLEVSSTSTAVKATTNDAADVGSYFATLSGTVSGTDAGTRRYIRYWKESAPETIYDTDAEDGAGDYSTTVWPLEQGTTYQYQMTEYGDVKTFTTSTDNFPSSYGSSAAAPTASIEGGTVAAGTSVTLTSSTSGATIYYTTDGTIPTTSSTKYTGAITINSAMTLKAIAVKDGMSNSDVSSWTFRINVEETKISSVTETSTISGTDINVNLKAQVTAVNNDTLHLVAAVYNSDGRFVALKQQDAAVISGENSIDISALTLDKSKVPYTVKVMIWEGKCSPLPLCEAYKVDITAASLAEDTEAETTPEVQEAPAADNGITQPGISTAATASPTETATPTAPTQKTEEISAADKEADPTPEPPAAVIQ